jgi:hypothetical protein
MEKRSNERFIQILKMDFGEFKNIIKNCLTRFVI